LKIISPNNIQGLRWSSLVSRFLINNLTPRLSLFDIPVTYTKHKMKPFTIQSALTASALLLATNLPAAFADMVSVGCFSDSTPLADQGPYMYQSNGWCMQECLKINSLVFALTKGTDCLCGNELPRKSAKTSDSNCNVKCAGWPDVMCMVFS
jgi:hypothetical protein